MLKAAQYYPLFVTEDNIAQASHNLDNQPVTRAFNAVHIVAMTGDQLDHPFPARLLYGLDARPFQAFTQQHDKCRLLTGNFGGFASSQMRPRQLWMHRKIEPAILPALPARARSIA